jgi:alpha-glucosidase
MKMKLLLPFSIALNVLLLVSCLSVAVVYRDKLVQRYIKTMGDAKIVMFGNSITAQGKWAELLGRTDVVNSGLPGLCTYHFLSQVKPMITDLNPEVCFVMGGINDITVGVVPEKTQANYQQILETIVKNKILPVVTLTLYEQNDPVSKMEVSRLNEFLVRYCTANKIEYLDLNAFISDSTGLRSEFAIDKTHLNENAYKIWAREINKILERRGI